MKMTLVVNKLLEKRDVDAALYLLSKILGIQDDDANRTARLEALKNILLRSKHLSDEQRKDIISAYREVIG
jgi:hypothetical protein